MEHPDPIKNILFHKLIEKSIFTPRQIQIIYSFTNNGKRINEISSGAYYREVGQSKLKLKKICYSIMLLDLMDVVGVNQIAALYPMTNQLRTLHESHHNYHKDNVNRIMTVIDEMVNRVIKV
jgi:hypothetical protein